MKKKKVGISTVIGFLIFTCIFLGFIFNVLTHTGSNKSEVYAATGREIVVGKGEQYSTITDAIKNAQPGDIILVKGGSYNEQLTMTKSGKADSYITIKNYPNETPVLDGKGLDTIVDFNGQDYINFEGFKIQNITGKQWANGVYLGGGEKYINLRNLEITGIINPKPTSSNYGANPLLLYGEKTDSIANVTIENCYVHNNVTGWCEAIAVSGNCENIQILNNRVDNNGNIGIDFCGNFGYCSDSKLDQPRNCVARGNVISNCNSPYATSYGLYADGAKDIVFENNIISNSQGGIEIGAEEKTTNIVGNITVKNNLIYNCSENGITIGGYETGLGNVDNVLLSHNTVVNNNCELTLSKCSNITIQDNIFKGKTLMYSEMSSSYTKNITFNNNIYDGGTFMLANKTYTNNTWKTTIDKNAIIQSVTLNNEYILQDNLVGTDKLLIGYNNSKTPIPEEPEEEKPTLPIPPAEEEPEEEKPEEEKPTLPIPPAEEEKPEEKPTLPIPPVEEEKPEEENKINVFDKKLWSTDSGVHNFDIRNEIIQFKIVKNWSGIWLDNATSLKEYNEVSISVDNISKNTEIQVYINDKESAVINNKNKSTTIKIPDKVKNIDICIVSSKRGNTVKVEGLEINCK